MSIFNFGDIVIVHENLVGVVVKCWLNMKTNKYNYDVYVRSFNMIENFQDNELLDFVYDKELSEEDLEYYK